MEIILFPLWTTGRRCGKASQGAEYACQERHALQAGSCFLSAAESCYPIIELEMLAVAQANKCKMLGSHIGLRDRASGALLVLPLYHFAVKLNTMRFVLSHCSMGLLVLSSLCLLVLVLGGCDL